jgi:hypothetical protein
MTGCVEQERELKELIKAMDKIDNITKDMQKIIAKYNAEIENGKDNNLTEYLEMQSDHISNLSRLINNAKSTGGRKIKK